MAIDPKKIAEWKSDWDEHFQSADFIWEGHVGEVFAERAELLALLREIEWSAQQVDTRAGAMFPACPGCRRMMPLREGAIPPPDGLSGHAADCRLAAFLR